MDFELVHFEVGKRFPFEAVLNKMMGGEGGASLDYRSEDKTLCLYVSIPNPTKKEVKAFKKDLIRFAFYRNHLLNTAIIMVHFGTDLLIDLVYDINVLDFDMDGKVEGNAFHMYLIDSGTGILHGMRSLGLGKNFMKEINQITKNDNRFTSQEFNEWLKNDVYRKPLTQLWRESERIDWDK